MIDSRSSANVVVCCSTCSSTCSGGADMDVRRGSAAQREGNVGLIGDGIISRVRALLVYADAMFLISSLQVSTGSPDDGVLAREVVPVTQYRKVHCCTW